MLEQRNPKSIDFHQMILMIRKGPILKTCTGLPLVQGCKSHPWRPIQCHYAGVHSLEYDCQTNPAGTFVHRQAYLKCLNRKLPMVLYDRGIQCTASTGTSNLSTYVRVPLPNRYSQNKNDATDDEAEVKERLKHRSDNEVCVRAVTQALQDFFYSKQNQHKNHPLVSTKFS